METCHCPLGTLGNSTHQPCDVMFECDRHNHITGLLPFSIYVVNNPFLSLEKFEGRAWVCLAPLVSKLILSKIVRVYVLKYCWLNEKQIIVYDY